MIQRKKQAFTTKAEKWVGESLVVEVSTPIRDLEDTKQEFALLHNQMGAHETKLALAKSRLADVKVRKVIIVKMKKYQAGY